MVENLTSYLPFLIPLIVLQAALMLAAVIHILRHNTFRFGNRIFWILISVFINIIGPVLYFVIGRGEHGGDE